MQRRTFIKQTCGLCMAVGAGITVSALQACSSLPVYKTVAGNNKISVPIVLFENNQLQIIRPKGLDFDIALQKQPAQNFVALKMQCTHAENHIHATGNGFVCNLHGSRFSNDGAVIKGPAERPLKKYTTEITSEHIIIHLN